MKVKRAPAFALDFEGLAHLAVAWGSVSSVRLRFLKSSVGYLSLWRVALAEVKLPVTVRA